MNNTTDKKNNEYGSVLFFILIGVVLFAALSYTVAQMMRGGNAEVISEQKAELYAEEIIDYARQVRLAIQNMRISNGCSDEEISFENDVVVGYEHTPAVRDACKVFHPDGGGMNWNSATSSFNTGSIEYVGHTALKGIGTDNCTDTSCSELYMFVRFSGIQNAKICEALNTKLGHTDITPYPLTTYVFGNPRFIGAYGPTHNPTGGVLTKKSAFCYEYSSSPKQYFFIYTLLAR